MKLIVPIVLAQFFLCQIFAFGQSQVINTMEDKPSPATETYSDILQNNENVTIPKNNSNTSKKNNKAKKNTTAQQTISNGQKRIIRTETNKDGLVAYEPEEVTHIFFHTLTVDPETAYKSKEARGYNSNMATVEEFKKILTQLYENNYCLVKIHDLGFVNNYNSDNSSSKKSISTASELKKPVLRNPNDPKIEKTYNPYEMFRKKVYVPKGKTPLIISQDDVNYYHYMDGSGHASKLVIDNNKVKAMYIDKDGNENIGDYDLVPILDSFIEEHPDFSYNGAKAIIAFTGYNGVLGYRTDETYDADSPYFSLKNKKDANENIEIDREYARRVAKALYDSGYEFASHSWGHVNWTTANFSTLQKDCERWQRNVESILPVKCDIMIYPFGADIAGEEQYTDDVSRFVLLKNFGFRYFCNVDSNMYWVQIGEDYLRQGRRNIDGYRMWEALSGGRNRLSDLFDVESVFDKKRPTPIAQ